MGVRKRVTKHLIDGGIVVLIAIGFIVAKENGCFESKHETAKALPPCPPGDPWATGCAK